MTLESSPRHLILFLAANPASTPVLAIDEECRAIEHELRLTEARDVFDFRSKWAVDVDELMRHLNQLQPTVIHISGHGEGAARHIAPANRGTPADRGVPISFRAAHREIGLPAGAPSEASIQLHGEGGNHQDVGARALAEMIRTAAPSVRLVVLNACFSDDAAEALTRVVDCVVGMRGSITDTASRTFSIGFYRALGHQRSVGNAVAQANAVLAALQPADADLPVCRTRPGIDPDRIYLPRLPPRPPASASAPPPPAAPTTDASGSFHAARRLLSGLGNRENLTSDELFAATLARYPAVMSATKAFKEIILERLVQWIDEHRFHTFVPDDDWRVRLPRYAPDSEFYVSIAVRGRFEHEACRLEIGVWWQTDLDAPPEIYVGIYEVPWAKKLRPTRPDTRRDVSSIAYLRRGEAKDADAHALLEELEAAARIARAS